MTNLLLSKLCRLHSRHCSAFAHERETGRGSLWGMSCWFYFLYFNSCFLNFLKHENRWNLWFFPSFSSYRIWNFLRDCKRFWRHPTTLPEPFYSQTCKKNQTSSTRMFRVLFLEKKVHKTRKKYKLTNFKYL